MLTEVNIWKIIKILSIIGIVLASYLFYNFLAYNVFSFTPLEVCNISKSVNCDAPTRGSLSTIIGIPVSLIGLIGYFTILYSALTKKKKLALGMTTFGMIFCLRLTFIELFVIHVICPVCVLCQIIMFVVWLLSIKLNFSKNTPITS